MDENMTLTEKIDRLRSAGFTLSYADRFAWVRTPGTTYWADNAYHWEVKERVPNYVDHGEVHTYPAENTRAYVDLGDVARGRDYYDQTSDHQMSNYRSLRRDYPESFTDTSYSNVDSLGAYVGNLSPELVDILCGIKTEYPLYDESDLSELEQEIQQECWDSSQRYDLRRDLIDQAESDEAMEDTLDAMDEADTHANTCYGPREAYPRDTLKEMFGESLSEASHDGYAESATTWIFPDLTEDMAERVWAWRCAGLPDTPAWVNPDQVTLNFPGFPPIRGVGPVITAIEV